MNWEEYAGYFAMESLWVQVLVQDGRLLVAFPGVPPGFEVELQPQEAAEHGFQLMGGSLAGAPVLFEWQNGRITRMVVAGDYVLHRVSDAPAIPAGHGLLPPMLALDGEKEAAFAALLQEEILGAGDGRLLAYHLPYPKHEFLQYVAQQNVLIFHGSAQPDIDEFRTQRTSMELSDKTGRGNVQGIYGTHDGLWPLFFAVVNRGKMTGSIRNGFDEFTNAAGDRVRVYHFTINQEWLDKEPWHTGMLYFLPRTTFRQMPGPIPGSFSHEWVSEVAVRPLARLEITPEDFPFLAQVGGHDDSRLLRLGALGQQVLTAVTGYEDRGDWLVMKLNYTTELGRVLLDYFELLREFLGVGQIVLRMDTENQVWFEFCGPPAVMQLQRDRLAGLKL